MSSVEHILDVGDQITGFDLDSQLGRIFFRDIIEGKWCLLVTFNQAFDPVATSDLGTLCKMAEEFEARKIFVIAIGFDLVPNFRQWIRDIEELEAVKVSFAFMSDPKAEILRKFGVARENPSDQTWSPISHGAFLIDTDKRIRYSCRTSLSIGRNFYEFLRQFDALMMTTYHPIVCPANWGQGQQVFIRKEVETKDAVEYRCAEIKPWFRVAPCPDNV